MKRSAVIAALLVTAGCGSALLFACKHDGASGSPPAPDGCSTGPAYGDDAPFPVGGSELDADVTGLPQCVPHCGATRDRDFYLVSALPRGACATNGERCAMAAGYPCGEDRAFPVHGFECSCDDGQWRCVIQSMGGGLCAAGGTPDAADETDASPTADVASAADATPAQVPAPTFSPPSGSYVASIELTISDADPDATIFYTTDDTTPTTASSRYSGPLAIDCRSWQPIHAIAVHPPLAPSDVADVKYTFMFSGSQVSPVIFDPGGGTTGAQTVTLSSGTTGATICYTRDGSRPSCIYGVCQPGSITYTGTPVDVSNASILLRAMGCSTNFCIWEDSSVSEAEYDP